MDLVKSAGLMFFYQAALIMVKLRKTFLAANAEKAGPTGRLCSNFFSVIRIGTSCIIPYRSNLETSFR